jgi:CDP-2,3-bis-(O-geranylgeranyl)-sn-glycerol synthase
MLGDIVESFFKRRIGLSRGEKWLGFDQIDFIIGGLLLSLFVRVPEIELLSN